VNKAREFSASNNYVCGFIGQFEPGSNNSNIQNTAILNSDTNITESHRIKTIASLILLVPILHQIQRLLESKTMEKYIKI
jgi:hypothetical protein